MTRIETMDRIRKTLTNGEIINVTVAHKGAWSGADCYQISPDGIRYTGHAWNTCGTLRSTYAARVLNK